MFWFKKSAKVNNPEDVSAEKKAGIFARTWARITGTYTGFRSWYRALRRKHHLKVVVCELAAISIAYVWAPFAIAFGVFAAFKIIPLDISLLGLLVMFAIAGLEGLVFAFIIYGIIGLGLLWYVVCLGLLHHYLTKNGVTP